MSTPARSTKIQMVSRSSCNADHRQVTLICMADPFRKSSYLRRKLHNPAGDFACEIAVRRQFCFVPQRRKSCAMANDENTAVNELIARIHGGQTSSNGYPSTADLGADPGADPAG